MLEIPPHVSYLYEVVAFFLFAVILHRVIWAPTQKLLAERARRTVGAQSEALEMREEAAALERQLEATVDEARRAGGDAGEQVRRQAEAEERRVLDAAHEQAARLLDETRARVAREMEDARRAMQTQVESLARIAAERILTRPVTS
ncbi:MAG TPA: ATP synthase F0 subunit B [Candidatus Binatia bacterium]|nr:ATP synthase F0 subunit B [Candidatus Binatia bacterium]